MRKLLLVFLIALIGLTGCGKSSEPKTEKKVRDEIYNIAESVVNITEHYLDMDTTLEEASKRVKNLNKDFKKIDPTSFNNDEESTGKYIDLIDYALKSLQSPYSTVSDAWIKDLLDTLKEFSGVE